jgi:hypothetical protein
MSTRLLALPLGLALACSASPSDHPDPAAPAQAPLTGVPASGDSADRQCHVVLRDVARVPSGMGGYLDQDGVWIWEGSIDISAAAAAEGLVPAVMYQYGSDPTWWEVSGWPAEPGASPEGFVRFNFRLEDHLPGPGMSGSALLAARIQLIPVVHLAAGGRLFDHNRRPGDFDVYELTWNGNAFAIADDPAACPPGSAPPPDAPPVPPPAPATPTADLWFEADFTHRADTNIVAGGELVVHYALSRLTSCRGTHNGYPAWDLIAHARFSPGGQTAQASVRTFDTMYGHPVGPGVAVPASFDVPAGATSVELWFENTGIGCQGWDSALGANYRFEVLAPPSWLGDVVQRMSRDTSGGPCAGGAAVGAGDVVQYDTWVRQRAAVRNLCFEAWQPGLTDAWPQDLWKKLDARVHWRFSPAAAWSQAWASLDGRDGNNARWFFDTRALDPFGQPGSPCPSVPVSGPDAQGYVAATAEVYFSVNGVELRPAGPGSTYTVRFSDDSNPACIDTP